jgi:hypothetical protein
MTMTAGDTPTVSAGTTTRRHNGRRSVSAARLMSIACVSCLLALGMAASAHAALSEYSATKTIPVPPASNFAGSGGGDGWAVALSSSAVYNVFHHNDVIEVACHDQANAEPCAGYPKTVSEPGGSQFRSQGQPGLYLDQRTGKLYVFGTRESDNTGGVVCIDTNSSESDPFCGFTALTGNGEAPFTDDRAISGLTAPMLIGSHWYSFNTADGTPSGTKDTLVCFDVATDGPCANQPYSVALGAGNVTTFANLPTGESAAIAGKAIVPLEIEGSSWLACFDDATQSSCGGQWPVKLGFPYTDTYGAPFPLLSAAGATTGLCLPTGTDQCLNLQGESVATPAAMTEAIPATEEWNGPSVTVGPRVFVPNGESDEVDCYDYATGKGCANFPKQLQNLELLYTVNADPQRPTCIWVNADGGGAQIQNFDAYTGEACGQGTIRALASQFVVPQPQCTPASYVSVQVLKPGRATYTNGIVAFDDGDGNPIGLPERELDGGGTASLAGLELNTATGLPQFLFTLTGESAEIGAVEVKLSWLANYDVSCIGEGTSVGAPAVVAATPVATVKVLASKVEAKKCISSRVLTIHWTSQKSGPLSKITLSLNGKVYKHLGGSARQAKISFAGRGTGAVTLKIDGVAKNGGRHYRSVRTFHPCAAKIEDTNPVTLFLRHHS